MDQQPDAPDDDPRPTLADELAAIPYEPLLPAEKKLIAGSLILGVALLCLLLWVSSTYFPVGEAPPGVHGSRSAPPSLLNPSSVSGPRLQDGQVVLPDRSAGLTGRADVTRSAAISPLWTHWGTPTPR